MKKHRFEPNTYAKLLLALALLWGGIWAMQAVTAQSPAPAPAPAEEEDGLFVVEVLDEYEPEQYARDAATAGILTDRLPLEEVLGPLAPVALSPFFALLCLSGASLLATNGLLPGFLQDNELLMAHPVLSSEIVFGALLILTVLTSVPRFMTVTKVFAQTADFLETHAGIISYLVILVVAAQHHLVPEAVGAGQAAASASAPVISAGIVDVSLEVLLLVACAINIFVINSVRFFCELIVLVSPIPTVDAIFEAANKTVTGLLAMLYVFSPLLAALVSLAIFLVCLVVYAYVHHSVQYYRAMLTMPLVIKALEKVAPGKDWLSQKHAGAKAREDLGLDTVKNALWVYPDRRLGEIPKRAKCLFVATGKGSILVRFRLLRSTLSERCSCDERHLAVRPGALAGNFEVHDEQGNLQARLNFSRCYNSRIDELARDFHAEKHEGQLNTWLAGARDLINGGLKKFEEPGVEQAGS